VASVRTGAITETIHGHDGAVTGVAFRPTGELVTAGADGSIITWHLDDWFERFGAEAYVLGTSLVRHDERTLVLPRSDGTTQVVVAEPEAWEDHACRIAGRVLTEQEWGRLLGSRPYAPACDE
jgi:WD40 repeat protein